MISSFLEDGTPVPKRVVMILIVNCVLLFVLYCTVLYCIVFSAFVGQYVDYTKMHCVSNKKRTEVENTKRIFSF